MLKPFEITGIVLAGGKSSRMGKDKGLCNFNEKPLVEYALEVLKPFCGEILLSANSVDAYNKYGFEVVPDEIASIGPMGGIYSCLKKTRTKHNIVLSCDTPFISQKLIEHLISNIAQKDEIVAPVHKAFVEPLCAYYNSGLLKLMLKFINSKEYKLLKFFDAANARWLEIDHKLGFYNPKLFNNLNTPDDLLKC